MCITHTFSYSARCLCRLQAVNVLVIAPAHCGSLQSVTVKCDRICHLMLRVFQCSQKMSMMNFSDPLFKRKIYSLSKLMQISPMCALSQFGQGYKIALHIWTNYSLERLLDLRENRYFQVQPHPFGLPVRPSLGHYRTIPINCVFMFGKVLLENFFFPPTCSSLLDCSRGFFIISLYSLHILKRFPGPTAEQHPFRVCSHHISPVGLVDTFSQTKQL